MARVAAPVLSSARPAQAAMIAVGAAAGAALLTIDGWRSLLLALAAAGALMVTRVRFSALAAVITLTAVAAVSAAGLAVGAGDRPPVPDHHHHHHNGGAHR